MANKPHVVILGAGPAGLGAAFQLRSPRSSLESACWNKIARSAATPAASTWPKCESITAVIVFIQHVIRKFLEIFGLLGDDLLDRPRHGRIRLCGRWIHFPLKPMDLALRLPPGFAVGVAGDLARKAFGRSAMDAVHGETFASVLEKGLGRTICDNFYFPYVQKIWGLEPENWLSH